MWLLDWFTGAKPTELQDYKHLAPAPTGEHDFGPPRIRQTDSWGKLRQEYSSEPRHMTDEDIAKEAAEIRKRWKREGIIPNWGQIAAENDVEPHEVEPEEDMADNGADDPYYRNTLSVELSPSQMALARNAGIDFFLAARIKLKAAEHGLSFESMIKQYPPRFGDIRDLVKRLTYGEMLELGRQLSEHLPKEVKEIVDLPMMLHSWAVTDPDLGAVLAGKPDCPVSPSPPEPPPASAPQDRLSGDAH